MKLISSITQSEWAAGFRHVNCTHPGCNRWLTQRHLSVRPVGLTLRDEWYCSYRCAAERIDARVQELLPSVGKTAPRRLRMPLGLLLVSRGAITEDQLRTAKERHAETAEEMGALILALGFATEDQVTAARSSLWSCPVFTPPARLAAPSISIPSILMELHAAVPVQNTAASDNLLIGFLDRIDYGLLYAMEQIAGCKTTPCLLTPTDHRAYMESGPSLVDEIVCEATMTSEEITRTVCQHGAGINANELAIVRCGDYLWAHLSGCSKPADMLFRVQ